MKKLILLFSLIFMVGCQKNLDNIKNNNSSNIVEKENSISSNNLSNNKKKSSKKKLEYTYDFIDGFTKDDSLYVDRMLGDYPADIESADNEPYSLKELENLDYNKNLSLSMYNIRIPKKSMVFSKDKTFVIDFPKSDDYEISIKIEKLFEDGEYDKNEINEKLIEFASKNTMEKSKDKSHIVQSTVKLPSDYKNAAYSIIEDNKYSYTNIYMATPSNILNFEIIENKEKSNKTSYIMADLLSTSYPDSEDVSIVSKSLKDYSKKINLYATNEIDMGDFKFKIPSDMEKIQENDALTVYENRVSGKTINQIIISKIRKKDAKTLKDAFEQSQGSEIPPSYITSMGEVFEEIKNEKSFLKSNVRIYTEQFSLEGAKISFEAGDYYINMILTGPLKNIEKTKLLNNNIINSLEFK